jgi:hypothetical protein
MSDAIGLPDQPDAVDVQTVFAQGLLRMIEPIQEMLGVEGGVVPVRASEVFALGLREATRAGKLKWEDDADMGGPMWCTLGTWSGNVTISLSYHGKMIEVCGKTSVVLEDVSDDTLSTLYSAVAEAR